MKKAMHQAAIIEEFDERIATARTATAQTESRANAKANIVTIAGGLWKIRGYLKELVGLYDQLDLQQHGGATCQHLEQGLAGLLAELSTCLEMCRSRGLFNRTLTGGPLRDLSRYDEMLKDVWVSLSSSTDADLDETLRMAKSEQSAPWESIWR